jgi:hypothetical protein
MGSHDRAGIPRPGPRLSFRSWTDLIVQGLRRRLPEVAAATRGQRTIVLRYGGRTATITEQGPTRWIHSADDAAPGATAMATLYDEERCDAYTADVFAKSLAGFFDARLSRPESVVPCRSRGTAQSRAPLTPA